MDIVCLMPDSVCSTNIFQKVKYTSGNKHCIKLKTA